MAFPEHQTAELDGALGALHDHLDQKGLFENKLTKYLVFRLLREWSRFADRPEQAEHWASKIEAIDKE